MKSRKGTYLLSLLGMFFLCLHLCSCEKTVGSVGKDTDLDKNDFVTFSGSNMVATPEGYYAVHDNFLYFISPDLSKSTILCNKPECIHHDPGIEDLMDYTTCDAFFLGTDLTTSMDYYNGFLYIKARDEAGRSDAIYRISPDGSKREKYHVCEQFAAGFGIYKGYAYLGEEYYTTQGKTLKVSRFPVDDPEESEDLFETDQYPEASLNKLKFYDDHCYFYLYDPAGLETDGKGSSIYFQIDLETEEVSQLYEQSNSLLDWNDYGVLVEVDDYSSYNPPTWTCRYYRIHPHTGEKTELTEKDFASMAADDTFYNMDDRYLYFGTISLGEDILPPEQQMISVYDPEGTLKAKIPSGDFGEVFWVLPGTEQYLFIETCKDGLVSDFYYVDKEKFDGGIIEATKIEFSGRG